MADLIDRRSVLEVVEYARVANQLVSRSAALNLVKIGINELRSVDIVYCKDCRFCKEHPTSDRVSICTNDSWNREYHPLVNNDHFCSYGERRGDDGA